MGEDTSEKSILYELLEYLVRKQEPELIKCKNGTVLLPTTDTIKNALRYLNKRCTLPESLAQYVSSTLPWKFAVGDNGKILSILQENTLEIRKLKDEYSSVVAKASVARDAFPQWRKLAWSPDGTILALSLSNGNISFYSSLGNNIYNITSGPQLTDSHILEADDAVVSMIFKKPFKKDSKWDYEFIYVTYGGILNSYFISTTNNYQSNHKFSFTNFYKNGINGVVYCEKQNLFFVSGNNIYLSCNTNASEAGLTVWRPLNDFPYYKLSSTLEEDMPKLSFSIWNYIPTMKSKAKTVIFKVSISPNGQLLACLLMDGTVSLWNLPSLKLDKQWKLNEQPDYNSANPLSNIKVQKYPQGLSQFHPLDIGWWSDQALVIARYSGAITICSIKNLQNLLGSSPEFLFGPLQVVESSAIRGVLCLDCEINVMSAKRNSAEDEESASESDREASDFDSGTIFNYATTIFQSTLYSMTDIEKFQPKRRKSKIFHRTYRILGLKSTTPEELYSRKIEIEEYEEALNLAKTYHLDKDLVYQTQWRKSEFSLKAIEQHLSKVTKRFWVLNECVSRVPDNLLAARELLNFGLRQSTLLIMLSLADDFYDNNVDLITLENEDQTEEIENAQKINEIIKKLNISKLSSVQTDIIRYRRKLLNHMDMLNTYEILLDDSANYDKNFHREFRQMSPIENAIKFAKDGNCKGVIIMFTYFESVLIPHWLSILCFFPETLNPENYEKLLPKCDNDNQIYSLDQEELRQKDWSERTEFQSIIITDTENEDTSSFIYKNNPWFSVYRNNTLTQEILSDWYKKRCYEIERLSGLIDNALSLINIGKAHNIHGLEKLLIELKTIDDLVYKIGLENQTLDDLDKLTDLEKIKLLMSKANETNFINHVNNTLIPFAKKKQVYVEATVVKKLIHDYFISLSKNNLFYILEFIRFATNVKNSELHEIVDNYVQLAFDCLYCCDNSDMHSEARSIYNTIVEDIESDETRPCEALEILEKELTCLELLNKYRVKVPLNFLKHNKESSDQIKTLFIDICSTVKNEIPPVLEKTWSQLLSDLLDIQELVFRTFDVDSCLEIYLEARLKSGVKSTIQNSRSLMITQKNDDSTVFFKVPFEKSVTLVLEVSHEYFNNATSLVDPNMDLAKTCLHLIETDHKKIKVEFDLINSLQLLYDFDLNILPLQVKLMKDKLKLIEDCLNSHSDSYKYQQQLISIATYLRVENNARIREGKVLELIAKKAFQAEDYFYCGSVVRKLIELNHQSSWQVASDLGHCEKYTDLMFRRYCLWFVVNVGPDDLLQETIKYINLLEIEILNVDIQSWVDMKQARIDDDQLTESTSMPNIQNKELIPKFIESSSKLVKDSTIMVTQSMLDIVKKREIWTKNFVNFLNRNENSIEDEDCLADQSKTGFVQSFPCFYESLHKECKVSNLDTKYNSYVLKDDRNDDFKLCQTLLRVQMLKESSCNGEEVNDISQLLIECSRNTIMEDCLLAIGYLLSIKYKYISGIKKMFNNLAQTDLLVQLAVYYCCLKLYKNITIDASNVHLYDPIDLIRFVAKSIKDSDLKDDVTLLFKDRLLKFKKSEEKKKSKEIEVLKEKLTRKYDLVEDQNDGWNDQWDDADWGDFEAEEPKEIKNVDITDDILLICEPKKAVSVIDMSEEVRYKYFEEKYSEITDKESYELLKIALQSWPLFFDEQYLTADKNPTLKMVLKVRELFEKEDYSGDEILEEYRDLLRDQIISRETLIEFFEQKENIFSTKEILFLKLRSDESFHSEVVEEIKSRQEELKLPSVILEELFFQNLTPHFSPNHHMYHKILEIVFLNRKIDEIQKNIEMLIKMLIQQKNVPHAVALLSQLESIPPCLSTYDSCFQRLLKK